ncbi:putative methylesterase 11, chloroplastic [Vitis riparia]|uniref:putative methylesterase 11, chloroplastic n=1 Tax=Vitis riparia TaxID=96939 RepID=UPI00155ACACD|nr:putative methylesterase 11, chloroplastic [Vitis riparia]
MGNAFACLSSHQKAVSKKRSKRAPRPAGPLPTSLSQRRNATVSPSPSRRKNDNRLDDDALIRQQAVAAAILFRQHQRSSSMTFDRSNSVVYPIPAPSWNKHSNLPRSASTRTGSFSDSPLKPHQLLTKDLKLDELETKHFVLVHGGGFGAWCWYKTIALLEEAGFEVDTVDLMGSGIHSSDTNSITSLALYVKPLTDFLGKLADGRKVILVGHDFGGACISYAMELFPSKVAKAIFIAAAMLTNGQSTLDMFTQQTGMNDLMRKAQIFLYANGKDQPPTAIDLDKTLLKDLLFNQCTAKDVALASVSMRPIPIAPVWEKLSLSDAKYGSVQRFYIKTQEDCALPSLLQEIIISSNPPEQVFQLKGSDHSPFFSKPQSLHRLLVEISKIPPKRV